MRRRCAPPPVYFAGVSTGLLAVLGRWPMVCSLTLHVLRGLPSTPREVFLVFAAWLLVG